MTASSDSTGSAFDPSVLIDVIGEVLFGEQTALTQSQVAEAAGLDVDAAWAMWRWLGFPQISDQDAAFGEADVEALQIVKRLTDMGVLDTELVPELVRSMGRTFARLADWQTRTLLRSVDQIPDAVSPVDTMDEVLAMVQDVQNYIWRRHLMSAASRIILRHAGGSTGSVPLVVGFVDIVGYTSRSRQLSASELSQWVEWFERLTSELVLAHGGQVIKTIGDEVLFTVDDPLEAAELALRLVERAETDESFPEVRVGLSYGPVVARLGDVYGSTVNLAARLTSIARPGRVLVNPELGEILAGHRDRFRMRRTRRLSIKGYENASMWALKRPRTGGRHDRDDEDDD